METARAATSRWLLCVAAVAMVLLGFAAAQPKPFRPTLISFSPTQGAAGSTVTITFTGMNFVPRSSMLVFTPGTGLTVSKVQVVSPTQITAQVQIDANAQPGTHQIVLVDADLSLRSPTPFTITSPQGCSALAAAANCGPVGPKAPAIREFSPLQGSQGSTVALTLTGVNFSSPAALQFSPGSGLTVQSTTVVNANEIHAQVSIAPNAPLGERAVGLIEGTTRVTAPNTFTVVGSQVHTQPAQILRVIPNQITAGSQNVDLTLQGNNFSPGTQVTFTVGAGVPAAVFSAGPARYVNSTEIHVIVSALSSALPGGRDINLQAPNQQAIVGKGMLNVQAVKQAGPPALLKIPPITLQNFPEGVITLDAPLVKQAYEGGPTVVPLLDDDAVFQWHEQNPGTADYYELRIYAQDKKSLITKKTISGPNVLYYGRQTALPPTYYRPDSAFLTDVLQHRFSALANGKPQMIIDYHQLYWQVAGFHTYTKNGVMARQVAQNSSSKNIVQTQAGSQSAGASPQPAQTTDLEVEVSTLSQLGTTQAPTGLQCNGSGMSNGLNITDADKTQSDPNAYVLDRWLLSGTVNLTNSPYRANGTPQESGTGLIKSVSLMTFDNVFVDWGDGTVQSLSAIPTDHTTVDSRGIKFTLPNQINQQYALWHAYQTPNSYTVRVFQLSEADAQHVNASLVAASVDGPLSNPYLQTALLQKIAMPASGGSQASSSQGNWQNNYQSILSGGAGSSSAPSPAQVAADAYMLYCHPVTIVPVEDLAADGPLHLKSIDDPNFPGYDVNKPLLPEPKVLNNLPHKAEGSGNATPHLLLVSAAGQKPKIEIAVPEKPQSASGPAAICSTCDDGMVAESRIHYYGRGQVQVTWTVDGQQTQQSFGLGPSKPRTNLTRADVDPSNSFIWSPFGTPQNQPYVDTSAPLDSQALPVKMIGMHNVSVQADVVPEPSNPNLSIAVGQTLHMLTSGLTANTGGTQGISASGVQQAKSLLNTLAPPPGSSLPPLKVGVLSPSKQGVSGLGAVQYLNSALQAIAGQSANQLPDQHVASNTKEYEALAADPKQPCKFLFPVSDGTFEIDGLQNHVTRNGTRYTGTGNLIIQLANASSGGYQQYPPIPVKIDNWDVPDGQTVSTGTTLDVSPSLPLDQSTPALQGTIDRLQGTAGTAVNATLSVTLKDDTLRLPGEQPVAWNGVKSVLHPNGDWTADGLTLPRTIIGWSAFQMQANQSVRLDLSHNDGDAGNSLCGPLGGKDWVGVRFSTLTVYPYTMDLVSGASFQTTVGDWGINDQGLCGGISTGPFSASVLNGSIGFASVTGQVKYSAVNATYNGLDVYAPLLGTHVKGNATLQSGGGKQANISFNFTGSPAVKAYGNVSFSANHFSLTTLQGLWGIQADTVFSFSAENSTFAALKSTPFFFGMDGRGYLPSGLQATDIPLGGSSHLGHTPVDLVSAHLTVPSSGNQILGAQIATNVHLSEVMPAAPMQVNYELDETGSNYASTGPANSHVDIDVPYPPGSSQPSAEAHIHPVYSGGPNTEYSGSVDLSEIGGPSITGEFRLGYQGGHDYWLTRVGVSLPSGVPVAPGLSLFKVQGGLGHNFPIGAFEDVGSLNAESPVLDNSFLFMAGARIGTSDQFTCTVEGDLTIKAGGQNGGARMDFHAWILKQADNSNGDFKGYFQYAGSNFDGRIWGNLDFMNNAAYVDLGNGPTNAAIDFHFGPSGPWHIDFGKQQGPRVRGHLLVTDADMYMMLSPNALSLGGGESIDLEAGDSSINGYIKGNVDMGLTVTPQPHIAGDFSASVEAGACVYVSTPVGNVGGCVNVGVSAQVHAEFAPLDVHASASVGTPVGDVTVTVHL
ncbi:MAG: IPT/TIG domain-containing protein [Terriglobales bacterium]